MKKNITIFLIAFLIASLFVPKLITAQTPPQKMSYQAVIRNNSNVLIASTTVGMKISILQSSLGTVAYAETQTINTNANGLVSLEIGGGTPVTGTFAGINWANGPYYIKTETDPTGGTSYSIAGTSQLLSVPYALYAKTAESIAGGISETDPIFTAWDKSTGISITKSQISDLGNYIETETDPTVPTGTQTGEMQYWNGTAWVTVTTTVNEGATLQMIGGVPTWVGGTPPFVTNPTTGEIWLDRNLGASQVATSSSDAASYGDLYQWGRAADGHQSRTSATTNTLSSSDTPGHGNFILATAYPNDWRSPQNDNLWQGVSGVNNPCPSGYRLPTAAELDAERTSWSSNNTAGAFASPLKLPVAGNRYWVDGTLQDYSVGRYWSSTVDNTNTFSQSLVFYDSDALMYSNYRAAGLSVRCLKD